MAIQKKRIVTKKVTKEMLIENIFNKNRLMQMAMELHPKALPRASMVGRIAKEMSDFVTQLENMLHQSEPM